jgi:hypothetical protein
MSVLAAVLAGFESNRVIMDLYEVRLEKVESAGS